jgi:DNA polymerase-3 subunit alpha
VGRVLGFPIAETDKLTKLVPGGLNIELKDVVRVPDIKKMIDENVQVQKLFAIAMRLEGLCQNAGMHAAGVIVCDKPLDTIVPLYKNGEDVMTQWDGPTCEKIGLLKMDFLGLRTLTILERALDLIDKDLASGAVKVPKGCRPVFQKGRGNGFRLDVDKLATDDPLVFQTVFQKGATKGVFQFESGGMKDLLIKMKPDRLEDLIAANALYRPGPMELIPDYCARKHGKQAVPSLHPLADEILSETYGVMVYQEQVMRMFNRLGDIPLRRAYDIIKAISKKNAEVIAKERVAFIEGAVKNGLTKEKAEEVFADIEKFAGYGFNKSHSTRYAIVAYQTAWLKTYFPAQYMAALLTFEMIDQAKTVEYIDECRRLTVPGSGKVGIDILPPDINESDADFRVVGGNIRFGLAAIKGVGEKAVESIMSARRVEDAQGEDTLKRELRAGADAVKPYKSLFDFCERVDLRVVNKSVIESLIKCGAFDAVHPVRAASMAAVETATRMAQQAQEAKRAGQESLFGAPSAGGGASVFQGEPKVPAVPEWAKGEKMALEKSVLGFYVTSHPLRDVEATFQSYITLDTQTIKNAQDRSPAIMGGLISKIRMMTTKSGPNAGSRWAILLIEDLVGSMEVVLYSAEYERFKDLIKADALLFFEGFVDKSREEPSFKAKELYTLEQVQKKKTREILIVTNSMKMDEGTMAALAKVLAENKGGTAVKVEISDLAINPPVRVQMQLGTGLNIQNNGVAALRGIFGEEAVVMMGPNRRVKRVAPVAEAPLVAPSDELVEVG